MTLTTGATQAGETVRRPRPEWVVPRSGSKEARKKSPRGLTRDPVARIPGRSAP